jgi:hypothetical protein
MTFNDFSFLESALVAGLAGGLGALAPQMLGYRSKDFTWWELWGIALSTHVIVAWVYWCVRWVWVSGQRGAKDDDKVNGGKVGVEKIDVGML